MLQVPANAASCASKVVGSWTVRVDSTGQTYPAQFLPNGRSQVVCPMCTPGGSWSCEGNTVTVHVDNGVVVQHQLQSDGQTMTGGCCTITRLGGAQVREAASNPQPGRLASKDAGTLRAQQGNCSDITGLGGSGPTNCTSSNGVSSNLPSSSGRSAPQKTTQSNAAPSVTTDSRSKPTSGLRLPGALSLLNPETASADDGGPAQKPNNEQRGCAAVGDPIPTSCNDEFDAKNCRCTPVTNNCGRAITVQFSKVGPTTGLVNFDIGPNSTEKLGACTRQRNESYQYNGWKFNTSTWAERQGKRAP